MVIPFAASCFRNGLVCCACAAVVIVAAMADCCVTDFS